MTTTAGTPRPPHRDDPRPRATVVPAPVRVALRSLLWGPVALTLVGAVAGAAAGLPVALGLVAGGGLALLLLAGGTLVVAVAARVDPRLSLLVAVTTFALHAVLAGVVFHLVTTAEDPGAVLSVRALATGLLAVAAAWTLAQVVASSRARVPVYDLPPATAADPSTGPVPTASERLEAGAP